MESKSEEVVDSSWIADLESALLSNCKLPVLQKISCGRDVPSRLRPDFWQACLGIKGKETALTDFYDLEEQNLIRNDCQKLVDNLGNDEIDKLSVLSDIESVVTTFVKKHKLTYCSNNGWLEVLQPLIALKIPKNEVYNIFEVILEKYIPVYFVSNADDNDQPFHFLRLLLLYHDPELCSFLDTKKITPDMYVYTWLRSLFSAHCSIKVVHALWDVYFLLGEPCLVFFLALVMLVNAKEQVMEMKNESREKIIETLNSVPSALELEDIPDLLYLAEQHYVSQTPKSVKDISRLIFETNAKSLYVDSDLAHALCLPVPVTDLLPCTSTPSNVRYFVVDCRPAEQYNNGHLSTAFHLDCSLMLQEPLAFNTAVQALLSAQEQAIKTGSVIGGKHLCFMGSGRIEEDQFLHMVVASFLQKHHKFVSVAFKGYAYLHQYAAKVNVIEKYFVDHNKKLCIPCQEPLSSFPSPSGSEINLRSSFFGRMSSDSVDLSNSIFDKFATVVKSKSMEMKGKLVEYITNPNHSVVERHVSSSDKVGKRYRASNKFVIDDNDDGLNGVESDDERNPEIDVDSWCKREGVVACFKCQEVKDDGNMYPSYLILTNTHLFILHEIPHNKGYAKIMKKRPLELVVQITSKRKCPDLITFKYGQSNEGEEGPIIMATDLLLIPKPFEVTRLVKQQVIKVLDGEANGNTAGTTGKV